MSDERPNARCSLILDVSRYIRATEKLRRREQKDRLNAQLHVALLLLISAMVGWLARAIMHWLWLV